jgi:hypothetical protein
VKRYDWNKLNRLQLGAFAEYFAKMEFAMQAVDIYGAEVDDRGIDFVARTQDGRHYDVQVKSVYKSEYIFLVKSNFVLRANLLLAVVMFRDGQEPTLLLIPSTAWLAPNQCLVSRDYVGKKSAPEWGLQLSKKHHSYLSAFEFHKVADTLFNPESGEAQ